MYSDNLVQAAQAAGIETGFYDIEGKYYAAKPEVLQEILAALCAETLSDGLFDDVKVCAEHSGEAVQLPPAFSAFAEADLRDEQGLGAVVALRADEHGAVWAQLPQLTAGYYTLTAAGGRLRVRLIVAPAAVYQPRQLAWGGRMNGITVQLYSLRSARNWGIGDFSDLAELMAYAGSKKLDFVGINPLHALFGARPAFASPYSPSSRERLNPIYLDVERVGAFSYGERAHHWLQQSNIRRRIEALRTTETVAYTAVWAFKRDALQLAFHAFETESCQAAQDERAAFEAFVAEQGEGLAGYALFEALDQYYARPHPHETGWVSWPKAYQNPNSAAVQAFAESHAREVRFYMWLQWLCAQQLREVEEAARRHGVKLGLYGDLAVGAARGSADTWLNRRDYCMEMSVGAPPDPLGPQGQNWNLPPLNPRVLHQTGYEKFIRLLRENMRRCGVLRIDHVMALCRLWWVSGSRSADFGAYVHYRADILFAILALESCRNRCVVVGEDLGTVPDEARYFLNRYQVFSYKVMYFSKNQGGFELPQDYPVQALTVVSTHDVAPLAGWWTGQDLHLMRDLGALPDDAAFQTALSQREADKADLFAKLKQSGCLPEDAEMPSESSETLLSAVHRYAALSSSRLYAVQMENLLGVRDNLNVPGVADGYPNWACKLPLALEDFAAHAEMNRQLNDIEEIAMSRKPALPAYHELDRTERDTIDGLFNATHNDLFAYLGRHQLAGGGEVVRTLAPDAFAVDIIERSSGRLIVPSEKVDARGFFVAVLPENAPDYALDITYSEGGEAQREEDPYRFGTALQEMDLWLSN